MLTLRVVAAGLAALLVASACGGALQPPPTQDPLAGRYTISGGGGALEPANALKDAFAKQHPGVLWAVEDVGSDAGISLAAAGSIDLGMISRDLRDAEKGKVETLPIGISGTAVAVNSANPVKDLSKAQVRDIYGGKITDWSSTGGGSGKITVFVRETGSATRSAFESFFFEGKPAYGKDVIEVFELDETLKALRSFKDSVGMLSITNRTLTDTTIRLVSIDGVAPSKENLQSGAYKIRRPLYFVYSSANLKPAIRAFLDFVRSPEGQRIIAGL